ncbi:MAG: hypothetical protein J1E96_04010 [Ruminococcus sp.]|nr:hypothetical protein [Ruminococcus sp.]
MKYKDLTQLISDSASSRRFFLSLPVEMQLSLHSRNDSVHTAEELREMVHSINRENHYLDLSQNPFSFLN